MISESGEKRPGRPKSPKTTVTLAAALATGMAANALAKPPKQQPEVVPSSQNVEMLRTEVEKDARNLVDSFQTPLALHQRVMSTIFKGKTDAQAKTELERRSTAKIPSVEECRGLLRDYNEQLTELFENIPENEYGFFIAGDLQRLYVIKNSGGGTMRCETSISVATSEADWSNVPDSGGTGLGLQWVGGKRKGVFGEVVSVKDQRERRGHFGPPVSINGREALIIKSLDYTGGQLSTIATMALELWNPITGTTRGTAVHSGNREDVKERASGGCVRVRSHVDMLILFRIARASTFAKNGVMQTKGTPIMIAAKGKKPDYGAARRALKEKKKGEKEKPPMNWDFKPHNELFKDF